MLDLFQTSKALSSKGKKGNTMKATNTRTSTTAQATNTTFADLLRAYEEQAKARTPQTERAYTEALTNIATATAHSVLKKCIDTSQNPALVQLKWDIVKDTAYLNKLSYALANAYTFAYNKDGERVQIITDKDLHKALAELCAESLGDGLDLVHDAIITIMEETEKAKERNNGTLPQNFMEEKYTIRRLKRKVWIKVEESANGWETVETSAIQETYKAVRRTIEHSRTVESTSKYTYLQELATDEESGTEETIYRRLPKYADMGSAVCDFNGKETAYTADEQTANDMDALIAKLNLSKRQAEVLKLRLSGYGYKAIGTYLGIHYANVHRTVKQIQEKCLAIGLQPCTK